MSANSDARAKSSLVSIQRDAEMSGWSFAIFAFSYPKYD